MTISWLDDTWGMCDCDKQSQRPLTRNFSFWLLVVFIGATALLGRLAYLTKPFDHDARIFVYLGKLVCDGGRFYHDVLDNKFPSVGLVTSVCWRWLGTWWPGYVFLQTLLAVVGALLLARMAGRAFGQAAKLPTALFSLVYLNFNVAVFGGFQLETLQTFFAILAAGAALEAINRNSSADAFVVGLAAGCAAMLKPTGLAPLGAFAVATVLTQRRNLGRTGLHGAAALLGLLIPASVVLIYLKATNVLADMPQVYRQISTYAAQTPWDLTDYFKPFVVLTIALFPVAVRAWVFRRDTSANTWTTNSPASTFAIAWFALELAGAIMQRRMYAYHFLPVAAPAALLYGMWPRRDRVPALAAALMPLAIISIVASGEIIAFYSGTPGRSPVSDYLIARTSPADAIWADSMPRILLETDLKPGSRIPLTFLFLNYDEAPLEYSSIMLDDFEQRRPRYIIMPMDLQDKLRDETSRAPELLNRPLRRKNYVEAWQRIQGYVKSHYVFEKTLDGQMIYRRQTATQLARSMSATRPVADVKD